MDWSQSRAELVIKVPPISDNFTHEARKKFTLELECDLFELYRLAL